MSLLPSPPRPPALRVTRRQALIVVLIYRRDSTLTLKRFIEVHDTLHHGPAVASSSSLAKIHPQTDFARVMCLAGIKVINNHSTIEALWAYLDGLDLLDEERLRPGWDLYFMVSRLV